MSCSICDRPTCPTLTLGPEPVKWVWEYRRQPDGTSVGQYWLTKPSLAWYERAVKARWDCEAHRVDWRGSCLATREELSRTQAKLAEVEAQRDARPTPEAWERACRVIDAAHDAVRAASDPTTGALAEQITAIVDRARRARANAAALLWAIWDDGLDSCACPVMALLNLCLGDGVHAFHRDRCEDGDCPACWYLAHAEDRDRDRED